VKAYWTLIKGSFQVGLAYRSGFIFTILNNLAYMGIAYFLWKSIYQGREVLKGLTFNQTFLYITVASTLIVLMKTWLDWEISYQITEGSIIMSLVKPLNYQWQLVSMSAGFSLTNLVAITIPSLLFLVFIFRIPIEVGIGFLFFPLALVFSFLLSTTFDFIIGLTSFYTESIWGISTTKEIIITFLSGSLIPLQFFPETAQRILQLLPFQAMYHLPLMMLTEPNQELLVYFRMLAVQLFWIGIVMVLARAFYKQASKVLRVSGG
jgi:ABC-2 type transport system permease protein